MKSAMDKLKTKTMAAGAEYDSPASAKKISGFVKQYKIDMSEFDPSDMSAYPNFNAFFYRHVRPERRPLATPENPNTLVSAADCRLNVFETVNHATDIWIKGTMFSLEGMLKDATLAKQFEGGSMAIFRLAPQDYHRFHSPVDGQVISVQDVDGTYFSVNPMVVRSKNNVFTENRRSVAVIDSQQFGKVAFVAVGAAMVGSIHFTGIKMGSAVSRGDDLGYFAYGGSTVVVLFQPGAVHFDEDLTASSLKGVETVVKVKEHIGTAIPGGRTGQK
jgi:phosphatidylserine decarboxylase